MNGLDVSLARLQADALRQRLLDTASYMKGLAAVVESLNKGAADGLEIAIHAVEAVGEDLLILCKDGSDAAGCAYPAAIDGVSRDPR